MGVAIPAEVFRHGDGQAVSIPAGLELPAGGVTVRQDGPRLVIEPRTPLKAVNPANQALVDLLMSWEPIDERLGAVDDPPPEPVNL